jgi:hypothetical protein
MGLNVFNPVRRQDHRSIDTLPWFFLEVIHDLTSPPENENGNISLHHTWFSFPLDGERQDRGAREPIKAITPTFLLPRQGEGNSALSPAGFFFISQTMARSQTNFDGA